MCLWPPRTTAPRGSGNSSIWLWCGCEAADGLRVTLSSITLLSASHTLAAPFLCVCPVRSRPGWPEPAVFSPDCCMLHVALHCWGFGNCAEQTQRVGGQVQPIQLAPTERQVNHTVCRRLAVFRVKDDKHKHR